MRALSVIAAVCVSAAAVAQDGIDIPSSFGPGSVIVTQNYGTSYGNDVTPCQDPDAGCDDGSEMDRLFIEDDGASLHIGVTGNLQYNGNAFLVFIDSISGVGQSVLNTDPIDGPPFAVNGLHNSTLDPCFRPDYILAVDTFAANIFVSFYTLTNNATLGTREYLGQNFVGSGDGTLSVPDVRVAFDNSNTAGVNGSGDPDPLGDPASATNGMEAVIDLGRIGGPGRGKVIKIWALLKSGSGEGYVSNQSLPPFDPNPGDANNGIGNSRAVPEDPASRPGYDFSSGTWPGTQWVAYQISSAAAPSACDTNCDGSINSFDIQPFVDILSGDGEPCSGNAADTNGDGSINSFDIQGFVDCLDSCA